LPPPLPSPLFPYTTLFRSVVEARHRHVTRDVQAELTGAAQCAQGQLIGRGDEGGGPRRFGQQRACGGGSPVLAVRAFLDPHPLPDRKSTRLNSSHVSISYA